MRGVELGHALNRLRVAARIEINDLLVGVLERENNGIRGEGSKGRMEFLAWLLKLVLSVIQHMYTLNSSVALTREMLG